MNSTTDRPTDRRPSAPAITTSKRAALEAAIAGGRESLEAYALQCRQRRIDTSRNGWEDYRMVRLNGPCPEDDYSVISPEGVTYRAQITQEGVVRYPTCPDQEHLDSLNLALRAHGSNIRINTKHVYIADRLRELARYPNAMAVAG